MEAAHHGKRHQHQHGDDAYGDAQNLGDAVHFLLQRGIVVFGGGQHVGDFADLRAHAGFGDDGPAGALRNGSAVEDHVGAVAQRLGLGQRIGLFANRHGFAGQRGFGDAQRRRLKQTAVGGDGIAFSQHDHIARHHIHGVDAHNGTVSQHAGLRGRHLAQRVNGLLRFGLLNIAKHGIQNQNEHDDDGVERQRLAAGTVRALNEPGNQ